MPIEAGYGAISARFGPLCPGALCPGGAPFAPAAEVLTPCGRKPKGGASLRSGIQRRGKDQKNKNGAFSKGSAFQIWHTDQLIRL